MTTPRERADQLRAIKYQEPYGPDSSYGAAYSKGVQELVTELLNSLGTDQMAIGDRMRAEGITGTPGIDEDTVMSNWLTKHLGPGYYPIWGDEMVADLETPGDTEDADTFPVPPAIATFHGHHEDPEPEEEPIYAGLTTVESELVG